MLTRSSRVVIGSREKAKEMHSSLALQPSRKVQRGGEEGVDMPHVIRTLRARGVGAHCASTARGLDALVAEVIELCDESAPASASASAPAGSLLSARAMGLGASRQLAGAPLPPSLIL